MITSPAHLLAAQVPDAVDTAVSLLQWQQLELTVHDEGTWRLRLRVSTSQHAAHFHAGHGAAPVLLRRAAAASAPQPTPPRSLRSLYSLLLSYAL